MVVITKLVFAHSHFSAIWIIEVVSGETGQQKQGRERKTQVCGGERMCEAEQTGCAAKWICLENTVLRVQYLNIHIWGFTHLYQQFCGKEVQQKQIDD